MLKATDADRVQALTGVRQRGPPVSDEMRRHPHVAETRIELARVLLADGTGQWVQQVVGQPHRILGRIHARLGERDRAIAELREALAVGYREENLTTDPDLAEDPEFQAIAMKAGT